MSEKPILFSTPMVRALLNGTKTQTRRIVKGENLEDCYAVNSVRENSEYGAEVPCYLLRKDGTSKYDTQRGIYYPKYDVGDILWVRETWLFKNFGKGGYAYKADNNSSIQEDIDILNIKWRPSIHMPRAAARIFLQVTDVRVERVQDISVEDAIAEGCEGTPCDHMGRYACEDCMNTGWREPPQVEYMQLWDELNAKRGYGWGSNPWVWVIEFERMG